MLPIVVVFFCCCFVANAAWLRQLGGDGSGGQPSWVARRTSIDAGTPHETLQIGWTPKPTPAPGAQLEGERALDLLLGRRTMSYNWTNSITCGWVANLSCT
ncbi:hypothetical protein GGR52DRAFT_556247 [Hypoxylon sp. FL1284]|nr:hypothetical protein GGR52DRAFT_556247 [Hypoxylon sp. FL1284]